MKRHDIANAIINAPTPKEAKQIASQLKTDEFTDQLARWAKIKVCVMDFILRIKWNCCTKFRQALQSTEGMVVAEATSCTFWGVGVLQTWRNTPNLPNSSVRITWVNFRWLFGAMYLNPIC